jgi:hypothetical protein
MSLTLYTCFELKSLDYGVITIEFVNFLSTKFNGDILFKLPLICHPLGHFGQLNCKVWTESMMVMFGVSCKPVTLIICLDWASKWRNALDICVVRIIIVLYFNIFWCTMKLLGVAIVHNFQNLSSVLWNPWFVRSAILHPHVYKLVVAKCIMLFISFKTF